MASAMLILICLSATSQTVLPRRNIEDLDPEGDEFKAYTHALQILKDRSEENLYNVESFSWQAWVHNSSNVSLPNGEQVPRDSVNQPDPEYYKMAAEHKYSGSDKVGHPGQCVHRTDIFLAWHRAEFYYFEQILKNTDPDGTFTDSKGNTGPATANLRIPYWDLTEKPTGNRFPEVFEDESSILWVDHRVDERHKDPFYSKAKISSYLYLDWPAFGGYPDGVSGDDSVGGAGRFESQIHNPMHNTGVGGLMRSNTTAAYDPIFFSFHAYIDLVYDEWIRVNKAEDGGTMTSLDGPMRGDQPHKFNLPDWDQGIGVPETMGTVSLYTNHNDLGYTYEISDERKFLSKEELNALLADKKGVPFIFGEEKKSFATVLAKNSDHGPSTERGQSVQSHHISVSHEDLKNFYLHFETAVTTSYTVDVYIHPIDVVPDFSKKKFREKYYVTSSAHWGTPISEDSDEHAHQQDTGSSMGIFLGQALKDIYNESDPSKWVITTNLTQN